MTLAEINSLPPLAILLAGLGVGCLLTGALLYLFFRSRTNALHALHDEQTSSNNERIAERESRLQRAELTVESLRAELKISTGIRLVAKLKVE